MGYDSLYKQWIMLFELKESPPYNVKTFFRGESK